MIEPNGTPVPEAQQASLTQGKVPIIIGGKGQRQPSKLTDHRAGSDRKGLGELPSPGATVTMGVQADEVTHSGSPASEVFDLSNGPPTINISGSDRPDIGDYGPTIAHSGLDNISGPGKGRSFPDGRTIGTPITLPDVPARGYGVMPDPGMGGPTPKIPAPID